MVRYSLRWSSNWQRKGNNEKKQNSMITSWIMLIKQNWRRTKILCLFYTERNLFNYWLKFVLCQLSLHFFSFVYSALFPFLSLSLSLQTYDFNDCIAHEIIPFESKKSTRHQISTKRTEKKIISFITRTIDILQRNNPELCKEMKARHSMSQSCYQPNDLK